MDPVAEFLASRYEPGERLVEVGVGGRTETAEELREEGFSVVVTDKRRLDHAVRDDVFEPDVELYRGASAIYMVRPGEEMQGAALELAREVGCDLVVRPLAGEVLGSGGPDLRNVEGTPLYVWERS